jgi:hypothetical protein
MQQRGLYILFNFFKLQITIILLVVGIETSALRALFFALNLHIEECTFKEKSLSYKEARCLSTAIVSAKRFMSVYIA